MRQHSVKIIVGRGDDKNAGHALAYKLHNDFQIYGIAGEVATETNPALIRNHDIVYVEYDGTAKIGEIVRAISPSVLDVRVGEGFDKEAYPQSVDLGDAKRIGFVIGASGNLEPFCRIASIKWSRQVQELAERSKKRPAHRSGLIPA